MNELMLIEERNKNKYLSQKITKFVLIMSTIIFILGTLAFFNKNQTILFYSQTSIIIILLIISYLEYKHRKIENKLLSHIKEFLFISHNSKLSKNLDNINKKRASIDKLSSLLFVLSSIFLFISLILEFIYQINIFKSVLNISLFCFFILSFNEHCYSKDLSNLIDDYIYTVLNERKTI